MVMVVQVEGKEAVVIGRSDAEEMKALSNGDDTKDVPGQCEEESPDLFSAMLPEDEMLWKEQMTATESAKKAVYQIHALIQKYDA